MSDHAEESVLGSVEPVELFALSLDRHVRVDAREHLFLLEGLGDVVHAAGLEAAHLVLDVGERADEDDRDIGGRRVGLQLAARVETAHAGQEDVEQDEVGFLVARESDRALAVLAHENGEPFVVEIAVEHTEVIGVVVDEEDRRFVRVSHRLRA